MGKLVAKPVVNDVPVEAGLPPVKVISRYSYDDRPRPGTFFDPEDEASRSMTNQDQAQNADINFIVERYEKTGLILDDLGVRRKPMYGDFTKYGSYQDQQYMIAEAQNRFNALPVKVRNRFNNDVAQLVEFVSNIDKAEVMKEAIELGLAKAPGQPESAPKAQEGQPAAPVAGAGNGTGTAL